MGADGALLILRLWMLVPLLLCCAAVGKATQSVETLHIPRVSLDDEERILKLMHGNTPVILTGVKLVHTGEKMLVPNPLNTWFKDNSGHTVVHIPPEYKDKYQEQWVWPLNKTFVFSPDAAWGGRPGFFTDPEGSIHVDRDCNWFFAAQYGGRKQWTIRKWHEEAVHNGEKVSLGAFFEARARFQADVAPGEVLLWPPWLPHATSILDSQAFSINGRLSFFVRPEHERIEQQMQREIGARLLSQPSACQGTSAEEEQYRYGNNEAEDEEATESHTDAGESGEGDAEEEEGYPEEDSYHEQDEPFEEEHPGAEVQDTSQYNEYHDL